MGPLPNGQYVFVAVNYSSRFFQVKIMNSTTFKISMFARYGFSCCLNSDKGPQFVSNKFQQFLCDDGIVHVTLPQNRSILKCLEVTATGKKPMKQELMKFLLAYWTSPHSVTRETLACLDTSSMHSYLDWLQMQHTCRRH